MTREEARAQVKGYLEDYLRGRGIDPRKSFRCLNPEHPDRHPSMSFDRQRQRCKCFSCGASYDIFDLIGLDYGLSSDREIFDKAYSLYGITPESQAAAEGAGKEKASRPAAPEPAEGDFLEYFTKAREARPGSPAQEYLQSRGISEETAEKFWLGYDPSYKTREAQEDGKTSGASWRALIIPTGKFSYVARNIDPPREPQKKNRYRKKGESQIFNPRALQEAEKPVFIVEGELDALSIIEAGGEAVALGSTSNYRLLIRLLEREKPVQPLILALDADEEGGRTSELLAAELEQLGAAFSVYNPYGGAKDANEALLADGEGFRKELKAAERAREAELEAAAETARQEYMKTSAAAHMGDFLKGISENANTRAISTGFDNLDRALDGGFYEGLYILGAMSSIGKTTLALQIADNLARMGEDVIIFSLEMARSELMAKSLSRLTYQAAENKADAKTTRGITSGARWAKYSQPERALISKALAEYSKFAHRIFIHEGIGDIGINQVKETVEKHITITGRAPIVLIDYLQILAPYDMRATDKQNTDKAVLELKRLSRDRKIPVIGISSFNRDSYKEGSGNKGKVTQADFKESGAIEYSADVLIGLEFEAAGEKNYSERAEKKRDPREIRLVILKNRNGRAWETALFDYFPLFNTFEEREGAADREDPFRSMRGREYS